MWVKVTGSKRARGVGRERGLHVGATEAVFRPRGPV